MPNPTLPADPPKDRLSELRQKCASITQECGQILAGADREARALSDDELTLTRALNAEFESISAEIAEREKVLANAARLDTISAGRRTEPSQPATAPVAAPAMQSAGVPVADVRSINVLDPRRSFNAGTHGFASLGEMARNARHAAMFPADMDTRLKAFNVSTYQSEGIGSDGGFAVPPDFRAEILKTVTGEDSIIGRCTRMTTSSNELVFPMDETTPWASSGVVTAYWDGEGAAVTATKMSALKKQRIPVDKLTALVYVTDELLEDAPALGTYLTTKIREHVDFKAGNAIFRGTGVGMPAGFLNSAAKIAVTKVASQAADTLVARNIVEMYARLYAPCRANAVWFINQDIEPQLQFLMKQGKLDTGAVDTGWGVPLYVQPGGLAGSPYGTLLGRPVVPTQLCETLGDEGDIVLVDLSKYYVVTKGDGGPRFDTSIHFAFDQGLSAFRVTWRLGGALSWTAAISPRDGSNTLSCVVTAAERA